MIFHYAYIIIVNKKYPLTEAIEVIYQTNFIIGKFVTIIKKV